MILAFCCAVALAGEAGPVAWTAPLGIEFVSVVIDGKAVAGFSRDGTCAMALPEGWLSFAQPRTEWVSHDLPGAVDVLFTTPMDTRPHLPIYLEITVAQPEGEPRRGMPVVAVVPPGGLSHVPLFLADFVGAACALEDAGSSRALARIRELPRRPRRWLVQLLSVAALRRYAFDDAPTAADSPYTQVPAFARRCVRSGDCDSWVESLLRGLN